MGSLKKKKQRLNNKHHVLNNSPTHTHALVRMLSLFLSLYICICSYLSTYLSTAQRNQGMYLGSHSYYAAAAHCNFLLGQNLSL